METQTWTDPTENQAEQIINWLFRWDGTPDAVFAPMIAAENPNQPGVMYLHVRVGHQGEVYQVSGQWPVTSPQAELSYSEVGKQQQEPFNLLTSLHELDSREALTK